MSDQDNGDNVDSAQQMFQGVTDEIQNNTNATISASTMMMDNAPSAGSINYCTNTLNDLISIYNNNLEELNETQNSSSTATLNSNLNNIQISVNNFLSDAGVQMRDNPNCIVGITICYRNNKIYGLNIRCYIQPVNQENLPSEAGYYKNKLYTNTNDSISQLKSKYLYDKYYFNNTDHAIKGIKTYKKSFGSHIYDAIEITYIDETRDKIRYPANFSLEELETKNVQIIKAPTTYKINNQNKSLIHHTQLAEFSNMLQEKQNKTVVKASEVKQDISLYNEILDLINQRSSWRAEFFYLDSDGYQDVVGGNFEGKYLKVRGYTTPIPQNWAGRNWTYPFFLSKYWGNRYEGKDKITMFNFPSDRTMWSHWSGSYIIVRDGDIEISTIGFTGDQNYVVLPNFDSEKLSDFDYASHSSIKPTRSYEINNGEELEDSTQIFVEYINTAKDNSQLTAAQVFSNLKETMNTTITNMQETITHCDGISNTEQQSINTLQNLLNEYNATNNSDNSGNAQNSPEEFNNMFKNESYLNKIYDDILNNFKNMNSIKESFDGSTASAIQLSTYLSSAPAILEGTKARDKLFAQQESGAEKFLGETLAKRDNLFSKVVYDYMINEREGSDIKKVYDDIYQKNVNDMRQVEINKYYLSSYKKYINIVKFIILLCIVLVPILILNQNYLIPLNVTMFLVITILIIGAIYIIYEFTDIYMRDGKNFDKIKIPYDRTTKKLQADGKMQKKPNPFFGNITCIGDDCCDVSMVYDNLLNKCVLQENFNGYFDDNNKKQSYSNMIEPYIGMSDQQIANSIMLRSLNLSNKQKMNNMDPVTQNWTSILTS